MSEIGLFLFGKFIINFFIISNRWKFIRQKPNQSGRCELFCLNQILEGIYLEKKSK